MEASAPLEKILMARDAHVLMLSYAWASFTIRFDILLGAPARYRLIVPLVPTRMHIYSVAEMRELLLEYGATDTRRLRQDFRICQAAIENDPIWLANFHRDPR